MVNDLSCGDFVSNNPEQFSDQKISTAAPSRASTRRAVGRNKLLSIMESSIPNVGMINYLTSYLNWGPNSGRRKMGDLNLFCQLEQFFTSDRASCRGSRQSRGRYFFDPKTFLDRKMSNLHMKNYSLS